MTNPIHSVADRPKRLDAKRNYDQILIIASEAIEEFGT